MWRIAFQKPCRAAESNIQFRGAAHRRAGLSIFNLLVLLILVAVAVHIFFATVYRVANDGMLPTLRNGGSFFAQRNPYGSAADVSRGDVVVIKHEHGGQERQLVWRVIGVPGETIAMEGTSVWVNNERLPHNTIRETNDTIIFQEQNAGRDYEVAYDRHSIHPALPLQMVVTPNNFFLLGDNRHEALDSTYLGLIAFEQIVAKKL